jgi:hypothetical protein
VASDARRRATVLVVRAWLEDDGRLTVRVLETAPPNRVSIHVTTIEAVEEIIRDRLTKLLEDRHTGPGDTPVTVT